MKSIRITASLALAASALVSACNWVDSGGRQPDDVGATLTSEALQDAQPSTGLLVQEDTDRRVLVSRRAGPDSGLAWNIDETPIASGALDSCAGVEGFAQERVAETLVEACSERAFEDGNVCGMQIERQQDDASGEAAIRFVVPQLRSPIGLRYGVSIGQQQTAAGDDGEAVYVEQVYRELDLCLVSINDAPLAIDNTYVVIAGETLETDADNGLVSDDRDDDDSGNLPLFVRPEPRRAPAPGAELELRADGGFRYRFNADEIGADILDSFEYWVSDGTNDAWAVARIRVVAGNQAPLILGSPPPVLASAGVPVEENLAVWFADPEGAPLSFSFLEDLPDDGTLTLDADGVLSGIPGAGDVGQHALTLVADDGGQTSELDLTLIVEAAAMNLPPVFVDGSVFDQTVSLGQRIASVRPEFFDPEGAPLSYRSSGSLLPAGVVLNTSSGVVSGRPRTRTLVQGIVIEAIDPEGNATGSEPFDIRVL